MRVLMVSHRYPPDAVAGVERYTQSLAVELAAGGDEVAVVARRPGPGPVRSVREGDDRGVAVWRLVGGGVDRDRWLHLADPLERGFGEVLGAWRPDVVHVNHLVDLSPRFLERARDAGAAVLFTAHDFWLPCPRITLQRPDGSLCEGPRGGRACRTHCFSPADVGSGGDGSRWMLRALYFRRLLDVPDRLLCPSRYVADWFRNWGLEDDRMRPVPNGIRLPETPLRRHPRRDARLRLAILGAVVPHKGHHVVTEAIARAEIEADLAVHGPVDDDGYVRTLRASAGTNPRLNLRLFGPYEPDDLSLLLEDVDVLIAPSVWPETFCFVVREALARGVPAVATRLGALPDAIRDGVDGFLYDHEDVDALAAILQRVAREPELLERLREGAANARVPSLEEHARRIREEYVEACERKAEHAPRARATAMELAALERLLGEGRDAEDESAVRPREGVA